MVAGNVGRESVSGSLDPFKPFHRRFARLHNAATLIKINYTLASVRSFIRHVPPPLARARFFHPRSAAFFAPHFRPPATRQRDTSANVTILPLFSLFHSLVPSFFTPLPSLVYLHFIRDLIYRPPGDRLVGVCSAL